MIRLVGRSGSHRPRTLLPCTCHPAERLVNMSKHNYRLEPECSIFAGKKWVLFRSNMFGAGRTNSVQLPAADRELLQTTMNSALIKCRKPWLGSLPKPRQPP